MIKNIYFLFMKRFLLFFLILTQSSAFAKDPGDSVFTGIQVHTIKLQFDQPNYWDSLTIYYEEGNEQNIVADATVDGVVYDSVGVRFKGNSSYSHPNNKKPFKINFDEYREDQRWDGLKGIHLNNCWNDPTFMREKIHLDFCKDAGISAPRANYTELYINNEL
ncbi:MAG: hypothetical protein A2057_09345 [Ignavibacteria bacterium GWA2_35_9]|nr:MAG: hypothetical protein A2057_09345 [Ignavibacteria bacterium GWA2_35_9]OGU43111.1 MAG: hypothetical protein A2000_06460 [Ignavibacteria bacterium GWB2_36_8]OGU51867.1 MAG: hypothetical protein A2080_03295 [Ignavibacteria bacterium GWC2_36_12]OGV23980.1 MAG: hypothetical protein A2475_08235 [Ignavibacteria bacterium RIFOXYC2_FULL_35_21]